MIGFEKIYDWFVNVLCVLTVLFTFQVNAPSASANPIILEQIHHTGTSEIYLYNEIESSVRAKDDSTSGLSRVLSVKGVRPDHEVLAGVASVAAKGVTTADGFLFRGFTVKTPVNIPVQRFGNMSLGRPDFWGARIGTSQFANRTFGAIKPAWNPLTQYTTGVIPKGTPIKFGIIGPQGWRYPGGSFQFIVPSRSVINQSSKLIW